MVIDTHLRRRDFLATLGAITAIRMTGTTLTAPANTRPGRLKQAVCRGVFRGLNLDLDGQCRETARLGGHGIDLVGPADFPVLKKYGLIPTMVPGGGSIKSGVNDP
ncbi:MAG: hydroxypyruvate isomerase, partial [Acidobacteria bacterium]